MWFLRFFVVIFIAGPIPVILSTMSCIVYRGVLTSLHLGLKIQSPSQHMNSSKLDFTEYRYAVVLYLTPEHPLAIVRCYRSPGGLDDDRENRLAHNMMYSTYDNLVTKHMVKWGE